MRCDVKAISPLHTADVCVEVYINPDDGAVFYFIHQKYGDFPNRQISTTSFRLYQNICKVGLAKLPYNNSLS